MLARHFITMLVVLVSGLISPATAAAEADSTGGFRLGPRLQWRRPLTAGSTAYMQFAGGPYLLKGDGDLTGWPGWFLEAEIASNNNVALVLGYESLNLYEYQHNFSGGDYRDSGWVDTTDNRLYIGLKLGQWGALAATATIFGLAFAAVSGG